MAITQYIFFKTQIILGTKFALNFEFSLKKIYLTLRSYILVFL